MKRIRVFLQMIIYYPSLWLSKLHTLSGDAALRLDLLRVWSATLLKMMKIEPRLIHPNHIPLEDGYVFLVQHQHALDLLALAQILPIDFGLILDSKDPIRWVASLVADTKPLKLALDKVDFLNLGEELNQSLIDQKNLIVFHQNLKGKNLHESFFTWLKSTKRTVIPITQDPIQKIWINRKQTWNFAVQLPMYDEEYADLSVEEFIALCMNALKPTI